ncbi:MAG TPA: RnfH family protein [Burkholderiales bacterium]|nr:RnfH family protein [Burkholderiales bacterium]
MRIEVVYALPQRQERVLLDLEPGSTVLDAIQASGLLQRSPEIKLGRKGVWGQPVSPDARLRDLDRVEIYRPLTADPKEIRRKRAARARK